MFLSVPDTFVYSVNGHDSNEVAGVFVHYFDDVADNTVLLSVGVVRIVLAGVWNATQSEACTVAPWKASTWNWYFVPLARFVNVQPVAVAGKVAER